MLVTEVDIELYDSFFSEEASVFLTAHYYLNNTPEMERSAIKCFVGKSDGACIGIIGLLHNDVFESPYKAPYGGFRAEGKPSFEKVLAFVSHLQELLQLLQVKKIYLVQTPMFHASSELSIHAMALRSLGFETVSIELNQHFELEGFSQDLSYLNALDRKTLRRALKHQLSFKIVQSREDKLSIYAMLKESRAQRGIPLKMSQEHLMHVSTFVHLDFWAVYTTDGHLCAGGVVAHVKQDMVHVIYWGFAPLHAHLDANRVLSYHIFEHYGSLSKKYVDVGISTDRGVPNPGLIAFKENIGCQSSLRMEWVFEARFKL